MNAEEKSTGHSEAIRMILATDREFDHLEMAVLEKALKALDNQEVLNFDRTIAVGMIEKSRDWNDPLVPALMAAMVYGLGDDSVRVADSDVMMVGHDKDGEICLEAGKLGVSLDWRRALALSLALLTQAKLAAAHVGVGTTEFYGRQAEVVTELVTKLGNDDRCEDL